MKTNFNLLGNKLINELMVGLIINIRVNYPKFEAVSEEGELERESRRSWVEAREKRRSTTVWSTGFALKCSGIFMVTNLGLLLGLESRGSSIAATGEETEPGTASGSGTWAGTYLFRECGFFGWISRDCSAESSPPTSTHFSIQTHRKIKDHKKQHNNIMYIINLV